jgi:hypothetical protein
MLADSDAGAAAFAKRPHEQPPPKIFISRSPAISSTG